MAPDCAPPTETGRRRGVSVSSPEIRSEKCQDENKLVDCLNERHKCVVCAPVKWRPRPVPAAVPPASRGPPARLLGIQTGPLHLLPALDHALLLLLPLPLLLLLLLLLLVQQTRELVVLQLQHVLVLRRRRAVQLGGLLRLCIRGVLLAVFGLESIEKKLHSLSAIC